MKKSTLNSILSFLFLLATVVVFFLAYNSSKNSVLEGSPEQFDQAADLSSVKDQAEKLVAGLDNNGGLPVVTPTSKLSKPNPFSAPE